MQLREWKVISTFVAGEVVDLEESLTCEFKEIKGQPPVTAIGKVVDEYVVGFLMRPPAPLSRAN